LHALLGRACALANNLASTTLVIVSILLN
jgi:hypothetical protein